MHRSIRQALSMIVCLLLSTIGIAVATGAPDAQAAVQEVTVAAASAEPQAQEAPSSRPNILVFVTDDQRLDTMDVMPQTREWLGEGGVTYTNAVITTPLCCSARGSIFSGQYVHNHGIRTLDDAYQLDQERTMQHTLQRAGYKTGIAGKYFNGWDLCVDDPPYFDRFAINAVGYQTAFRVDEYTGESYDYYEAERPPPGHIGDGTCGSTGDGHGVMVDYSPHFVLEKSVEFLHDFESNGEDPWFLYVAPFGPHTGVGAVEPKYQNAPVPAWEPNEGVDEEDLSDKPPHIRDTARKPGNSASGAATRTQMLRSLMTVDDMMGTLRAELEALDAERDTLILFLSDNGYFWGEHRLSDKREAYEEAVRVPFLARWGACDGSGQSPQACPGTFPAGTTDDRIAANIDIADTVYAAAGITPDYATDGLSLLGEETRERVLIEHFPGGSWARSEPRYQAFWSPEALYRENLYDDTTGTALCRDDDPLSACLVYGEQPGADEFYDMRTDPGQLENLLKSGAGDPAALQQLSADLAAASACAGDECRVLGRKAMSLTGAGPGALDLQVPSDMVRSGAVLTTTFRNTGETVLEDIEVALDAPHLTARPLTPAATGQLAPGAELATTWNVSLPEGARGDGGGYPFAATADFTHEGERTSSWDVARVRLVEEGRVPSSAISVHSVSSEEVLGEDGRAANALDGRPGTFWHSEWYQRTTEYPHHFAVALAQPYVVDGISYQRRQDGPGNDYIKDYEVYVSDDGLTWGEPIHTGSFTAGTSPQRVNFDPVEARFVKLRALNSHNGRPPAAIAEFGLYGSPVPTGLDVEVSAEVRCLAGKAYVIVKATNGEAVPVDVAIDTPFGSRSIDSIKPGTYGFHAFTTRVLTLPSGEATVQAEATIDGAPVTATFDAEYGATTCGG